MDHVINFAFNTALSESERINLPLSPTKSSRSELNHSSLLNIFSR